jgi:hypothetical protein
MMKHMTLIFATSLLMLSGGLLALQSPNENFSTPDVLATAHELAGTTYAGYRYGSNMSKKQIDCTQFIQKVLEKILERDLSKAEAEAVNISGIPTRPAALDSMVKHNDPRTQGIAYALTEVMELGEKVNPSDARPGDLIQYWIRGRDGHYKGHAAIIESTYVKNGIPVARLFGSHKTLGRIGIAVDKSGRMLELNLTGERRRIYIVRLLRTKPE